jgi:predicted transcriptional regulator
MNRTGPRTTVNLDIYIAGGSSPSAAVVHPYRCTNGVVASALIFWHFPSMSKKETIMEVIRQLPESAGFTDAIREIRIVQRIEEGERAADEGRVRQHEDVRELIRSWTSE